MKKMTFDRPDPQAPEQNILFIDLGDVRSSVRNGTEFHRVEGRGFVFVQNEKMPVGMFARQIQLAPAELTNPFFFFNVDSSTAVYLNIAQRGFEFRMLYSGQFNPPAGTITSIDFDPDAEEEGDE